jgi:uroporphyrinogen III methyltransferase/synthase
MGGVSVCAIGPSTADRLIASGVKPDVVIPEYRVESISEAIASRGPLEGQNILIVRPDHLRDVLADDLAERGAAVTDLVAYRTAAESADSPVVQDLYRALLDGRIDAVMFTSPTAVRRFATVMGEEHVADLLGRTVVAAIGPVTAAAAGERGIHSAVVPDTYTVAGLVSALVEHFHSPAEK